MTKPRTPKSLKIGGQTYTIEAADKLQNEQGEALNGDCDENTLTIRYEKRLKRGKRQEVLIHEPLHVGLSDVGLDKEVEEKVVTVLAKHILQLLRDNAEFVKFITT